MLLLSLFDFYKNKVSKDYHFISTCYYYIVKWGYGVSWVEGTGIDHNSKIFEILTRKKSPVVYSSNIGRKNYIINFPIFR